MAMIVAIVLMYAWIVIGLRIFSNARIWFVVFTLVLIATGVLFLRRYITLNSKLSDLLHENYEVGKILVRRDMELSEANTRLISLDRNKSEFVSIAAHQLRTPLTAIKWAFTGLLDRDLGELTIEQQKILDEGLTSSIRMITLINDLLNVARIEEGRFGLRLKKQSIQKVLFEILQNIQKMAGAKAIRFTEHIPKRHSHIVMDEEKIAIALENILENAVKYTAPGGSIEITVKYADTKLFMSVKDSGIGIPLHQQSRVFNKFFRADNALRFQTSGTGLGLYVVKNIIDAHHGTISFTSTEGVGTTITLLLPLASS